MADINARTSLLAVVEEVTEGVPVAPTTSGMYMKLQDDFSTAPEVEFLENAELTGSLGPAQGVAGTESPTASGSHYWKSSGTVASAPDFALLLKSAFGAETIASTEYDTVAASTTTVIKVDTGEGATFQRGEALLIKDNTNGYRIRCIDSIAGDNLTIGFQVPTAPGTGVNLGRAVLSYPTNSGHPSLTLWHYMGNGGAIEMISGARVTEIGVEITAGEQINASYSLEGLKYFHDPITLLAADTKLDFTDDDGTWVATIAAGVYQSPKHLATAIQSAMRAANAGETATVTYSDTTGKFTIKTTGTLLSLLWSTGANAANTIGDKIGFVTASDDTGSPATTGYTSDNAQSWVAPHTPVFDTQTPFVAKNMEVMVGDTADYLCFDASTVSITVGTPKANKSSVCAETGISGSAVSERTVEIEVTARLQQHDADKFHRMLTNASTKFQASYGVKSGGNWVAGQCGAFYVPTASVVSFSTSVADNFFDATFSLQAYVNTSGEGEVFANWL